MNNAPWNALGNGFWLKAEDDDDHDYSAKRQPVPGVSDLIPNSLSLSLEVSLSRLDSGRYKIFYYGTIHWSVRIHNAP